MPNSRACAVAAQIVEYAEGIKKVSNVPGHSLVRLSRSFDEGPILATLLVDVNLFLKVLK